MQNARLDEAQAGIKIARRSNNNLRYADDTTLMAEIKEELKSLLRKLKDQSEKVGLKLNIQKIKIIASRSSHHFLANRWEDNGNSETLFWGGSKIPADGGCSCEIKRCLPLVRKAITKLGSILKAEILLCQRRSI